MAHFSEVTAGSIEKGIIFVLIGSSIGGLPVGIGKRGQFAEKTGSNDVIDRGAAGGTGRGNIQQGRAHQGSYRDSGTPVYKQIAKYLEDMGLLEAPDHAVLSEQKLRQIVRRFLLNS